MDWWVNDQEEDFVWGMIQKANKNLIKVSMQPSNGTCVQYPIGPGPLKTSNESCHSQESELLCQVQDFWLAGHSPSVAISPGINNYKNQRMLQLDGERLPNRGWHSLRKRRGKGELMEGVRWVLSWEPGGRWWLEPSGRQVATLAAQGPLGCFLLTAKAARSA